MASSKADEARFMKRLMADLAELQENPVDGITGGPLGDLLTEWHFNTLLNDVQYHWVLLIPADYPFIPPHAELLPSDLTIIASKPGRKGIDVCLPILEKFKKENKELGIPSIGWSPAYTIRSILCSLLPYLQGPLFNAAQNTAIATAYKCPDCNASTSTVVSPHAVSVNKATAKDNQAQGNVGESDCHEQKSLRPCKPKSPELDNYKDVIGFVVTINDKTKSPSLRSLCEFVSYKDFCELPSRSGKGSRSAPTEEQISVFFPLYMSKRDNWQRFNEFLQICLLKIGRALQRDDTCPFEELILIIIPKLFSSIVVGIFKDKWHSAETYIRGCFVLHRLMLRTMHAYPRLSGMIEDRVQVFIDDESLRTRAQCHNIGEWLVLLSLSTKNRWDDAAAAYLKESFRRSVMFYVLHDPRLGIFTTDVSLRLRETFIQTETGRSLLTFQVLFLDIAWPEGMSRDAVGARYDEHDGMPSQQMLAEMMEAKRKIHDISSYSLYFQALKLEPLSDDDILRFLIDSLQYAIETEGYHMTYGKWENPLQRYESNIRSGLIMPGDYSRSAGVKLRRLIVRDTETDPSTANKHE